TIGIGNSDAAFSVAPVPVTIASSSGNDAVSVNTDASHPADVTFNGTEQHIASLTANTGGTATVAAGGNKVLITQALSLSGTATLDLTDNDMIVDYTSGSPISTIRSLIKNAYDGGAWDQPGIKTSLGDALDPKTTALGYADNATDFFAPRTVFSGVSIDSTSVLVKYTYQGDLDLDGDADGADIGTWATNFTGELGGTGTKKWTQGDWDYDGDVDGVDEGYWAVNFTGELGGGGLRGTGDGGGSEVDHIDDPDIAAILQGLAENQVPDLLNWQALWA